MTTNEPAYLGDGVYAENDGYYLKLTADRTKTIYLEPGAFAALIRYAIASGWTDPETLQGTVDDAVARKREADR